MGLTVSCLIPAWNEAARLPVVLSAALHHPDLSEVIVIDDGSTDGTAAVARTMGARVLALRQNGGKSAAVAAGLAAATGDLILLLDADLQGLRPEDITALLAPVLSGRADASLSLRGNAPLLWRLIGLDYISGERVMPRAMLLPHRARIAGLRRFGLEVFVNRLWLARGLRLAVVALPAVASPAKSRKQGLWQGLWGDLRMMADIFATVSPLAAVGQILRLHRAARDVIKLSSNLRTPFTEVK